MHVYIHIHTYMHAYIHTFVMISHVHSPGVIGLPRQRKIQCRTHASKACCVGSARWCSYAVHALPFSFHAPFAFILSLHIRAKVHVLKETRRGHDVGLQPPTANQTWIHPVDDVIQRPRKREQTLSTFCAEINCSRARRLDRCRQPFPSQRSRSHGLAVFKTEFQVNHIGRWGRRLQGT